MYLSGTLIVSTLIQTIFFQTIFFLLVRPVAFKMLTLVSLNNFLKIDFYGANDFKLKRKMGQPEVLTEISLRQSRENSKG